MFGKRKLVLTATDCDILENLRTAIEVLKGMRVRFTHMQFDSGHRTGKGRVFLSPRDKGGYQEVVFILGHPDEFQFKLGDEWFFARILLYDKVQVIGERIPLEGKAIIWKVGTSFHARWEEPL